MTGTDLAGAVAADTELARGFRPGYLNRTRLTQAATRALTPVPPVTIQSGGSRSRWPRYAPPQRRPGCRHRMVTVGPGRSCVTVIVGPGRGTVTVTVGCGTGTLTVTVGTAFRPGCRLVAPRTAGTVIATISASPTAAAIASKPPGRTRFRSFLRCLLPGRGACGVITPLMVDPAARAAAALSDAVGAYGLPELAQAPAPCVGAPQELPLLPPTLDRITRITRRPWVANAPSPGPAPRPCRDRGRDAACGQQGRRISHPNAVISGLRAGAPARHGARDCFQRPGGSRGGR